MFFSIFNIVQALKKNYNKNKKNKKNEKKNYSNVDFYDYNHEDVIYGFAHTRHFFIETLKKIFGEDSFYYIASMFNNTVESKNNIHNDAGIRIRKIEIGTFLEKYNNSKCFKKSEILVVTKNNTSIAIIWKNEHIKALLLSDSKKIKLSFTWPKYISLENDLSQTIIDPKSIACWFKFPPTVTVNYIIKWLKESENIKINQIDSLNVFNMLNVCNAKYLLTIFTNYLKQKYIRQNKRQLNAFIRMCKECDLFIHQFAGKGWNLYNDDTMAYVYKKPKIIIARCKLIILWFLKKGKRVHFVLDDINDLECVNKKKDYFTYKELRFIFRYWEYLKPLYEKNKIIFYRKSSLSIFKKKKFKVQLPPWESKSAIWKKYIPRNKERISKFFQKNKNSGIAPIDLLIKIKQEKSYQK
ncbi:MAG: hypothetical protein PVI75_04955 [Gammaproteobacteria bacterium]|jgi:hypothetical protein